MKFWCSNDYLLWLMSHILKWLPLLWQYRTKNYLMMTAVFSDFLLSFFLLGYSNKSSDVWFWFNINIGLQVVIVVCFVGGKIFSTNPFHLPFNFFHYSQLLSREQNRHQRLKLFLANAKFLRFWEDYFPCKNANKIVYISNFKWSFDIKKWINYRFPEMRSKKHYIIWRILEDQKDPLYQLWCNSQNCSNENQTDQWPH
jgi:hypothetical protein